MRLNFDVSVFHKPLTHLFRRYETIYSCLSHRFPHEFVLGGHLKVETYHVFLERPQIRACDSADLS